MLSSSHLLTANTKSQLLVYREEITNFLNTVTIKFTPFAHQLGSKIPDKYLTQDIHAPWNPYYQNLCGEYSVLDSPIMIYSQETGSDVLFNKENLLKYPKSAALYRVPNKEYNTLIDRYPNQGGLIKRIVYPVSSMEKAISAPELSLVAFDDSLLFVDERESLITELEKFLEMVRTRWWVKEYCYEDLYATAFYTLLWESLPNVLLAQRIENIKTPFVHPFHIWEYLISHGLGDYRDILSINQARWLYRNLPWILKNKSKEVTLLELAKNILEEFRVDLGGITIYQDTTGSVDTCTTTPYIITTQIEDETNILDRLNTEQLVNKISAANLIPPQSFDEMKKIESVISNTDQNKLKTKYLEFVQKPIDTKFENTLSEFLWDTFIYRYSTNDLSYKIKIKDGLRGVYYNLFLDEILVILYFAAHAQFGDFPTNLPNQITLRIPYVKNKPDPLDVPVDFKLFDQMYYTSNFVDVEDRINRIPWHSQVFRSHEDFITTTGNQFKVLMSTMNEVNSSADALFHEAIDYLHSALFYRTTIPLNFDNCTTYTEFMNKHSEVDDLLSYYKKDNRKQDYDQLIVSILSSLFPFNNPVFKTIGIGQYDERIYNGLKNLFTQICGYNITFLDTPRTRFDHIPLNMILFHMHHHVGKGMTQTILLDGIYPDFRLVHNYNLRSLHLGLEVDSIRSLDYTKPPIEIPIGNDTILQTTINTPCTVGIGLGVDIDLIGIDLNA